MEPLLSDEQLETVKRINIANDVLNAALISCYDELAFVATRLQVRPIPLKGLSTAGFYMEFAGRPMRDIDLLVDRNHALSMKTVALGLGFTESSPAAPIDFENNYELPQLSKVVSIRADAKLGPCLEEAGIAFYHNSPNTFAITTLLEIHFDLELSGRIPVQLESDENRLSATSELFYLMYKLYVDAVILNKLKAIKLLGDIIRLVDRRGPFIDWALLNEWSAATNSVGLVTNVMWHLVHTFGLGAVEGGLEQSLKLRAGRNDLYFGDLIGRLVANRSPRYLVLGRTGNKIGVRHHV
ncbi:Uncharacterised nucleotidyltransferase [Thalassobaculum litoreum DSM 18839]|uniref:Uncharacterized nucleotidyltransferase n=2 Tax=Thalassobaculum TaxID=526215 RepID=A0A8G2EYJ7_9PROT|nr:Uncharacterised nucleotidyltransferase [Thalassobaculum litoreum DSM 18839]